VSVSNEEMKAKLIMTFVFHCAAGSIAAVFFLDSPLEYSLYRIVAEASPVIFIAASIVIFFRARLGYWLGLTGGLLAAPYFMRLEFGVNQLTSWNSWLLLNCLGTAEACWVPFSKRFTLLVFVVIPISVACSVLRLLPARWTFWGSPLSQRLWPEFALCLFGLTIWFVHSVSPYRLPMSHRGVPAELRILYVEKRGIWFHEASVFEFRDGKIWATRADRRWFQYRFEEHNGGGASSVLHARARAFVQAAKSWNLHTEPPEALRSWNAEGWYVVTPDRRFSFTHGEPPGDVKALFHEFERAVPVQGSSWVTDVCLGFCYDPPAALGFSSQSERSWLLRAR
jgi:hypothetical protein